MSNYLVELSLIHIALLLGYWCFLSKERQYAKMRFYLLGATFLALSIPLLKLPKLFFSASEPTTAVAMEAIPLEAMTVSSPADTSIWNYELLIWLYLAISLCFLLKFLNSVCYLICLERKSSYEKFNELYIRKIRDIEGSFTFFNWIFISDDIDKNQQDYEVLLTHERAHASLGHTYDILFFELFKICFWWLPTAWFIIKEMKKIHEYQADAYALESYHIDQYSSILISSTLKSNGLSLASSFHDGLIFKRLTAMKQKAKNVSPWKLGTLAALCALLFIVFACTEEMDQEIKEMGSQSNAIPFDQLPASMQQGLVELRDELSFMKVDVPEDDEMSDIEELQNLDPELIHLINVDKANRAIYIALKKDGANFDYLSEQSKMEGELFTVVEEQPEFVGGMDAFYRYIGNEISYPLQARQQGIEGRVFVQFVVERDGSLTEVKAVRGISEDCDAEAVRVIRNAPAFKPGKQRGKPVRVRMVMPIVFKLNEGKTNPDNSTQGMVIVEEVEQKNNKLKVDAHYAGGMWSGTVYDEEGGALPGVNILVAGTTSGTVSDLDGTFKLKADASQDLHISCVGYESVRLEGE
ncbi:TonB family protein [Catalinimonas alkaloidigena]|uniref:TonB family protein n=1 Tax=Catalinimonas alkaloidigena TaxID=1075417 RepID=UPI0024064BA2|nr:TonB family protein [Catalinimonas alkaloidigena]MDF9799382.1 TonB family protein [Catalinimonas alkaloidigena]